ncbi:hypothetical protein KCP71_11140 [Salmonella enterica subsp. enterica]|nr:hypothetical protein KCP71_11140 [Salmonella enterica subsp. enterica]
MRSQQLHARFNKVFSLGDFRGLSASVSFARNQYTGGGQNGSTPPSVSRVGRQPRGEELHSVQKDNRGGLQQTVNYPAISITRIPHGWRRS